MPQKNSQPWLGRGYPSTARRISTPGFGQGTLSRHGQSLDPPVYAEDLDLRSQADLGIVSSSRVELHLNAYLAMVVLAVWPLTGATA